jgi:hypothetical protein
MSDSILEIVNRWEPLGFLDGLPLQEKEELAQLYDTTTRVFLSKIHEKTIDNNLTEVITDIMYPTLRRLYRRVGLNINIHTLLSKLIKDVNNDIEKLMEPVTKEGNPIIDFCINFADTYEDEYSISKMMSKEDYETNIDKILNTLREILLNNDLISYVEKNPNKGWVLNKSEHKKSINQTRFWNQQKAIDFLKITISEINKNNE